MGDAQDSKFIMVDQVRSASQVRSHFWDRGSGYVFVQVVSATEAQVVHSSMLWVSLLCVSSPVCMHSFSWALSAP
eukprot:4922109-Amphidinium_carterae.1